MLMDVFRESEAKGNQLAAAPARGSGGAQGLAWGPSDGHPGRTDRLPTAPFCRWEMQVQSVWLPV